MILSELGRILTKLPVLVLVILIIPIFAVSASITGIEKAGASVSFTAEQITEVNEQLLNLRTFIAAEDNSADADALFQLFEIFHSSWSNFFTCDPTSVNEFRQYFGILNQSFIDFEKFADEAFDGVSTVLIMSGNYRILRDWMDETAQHIEFDTSVVDILDAGQLTAKRQGIGLAWSKYSDTSGELAKHQIYKILKNSESTTFAIEQKAMLRNTVSTYEIRLAAITDSVKQTGFTQTVCEYLELNIKYMQVQNKKGITKYQGFEGFNKSAASDRLAVLAYLVAEGKTQSDFSSPYRYGEVLNAGVGTSALDFVFNNLELITVPLVVLACLVVVFCIFDDIKKNTVLAALVSPQSRRKVITAKLLACAVTIALCIAVFALLFFITALIFTGGASAPAVLTAFGGKALIISPFALFIIYLMSLFFKILVFAAVTALFCIDATSLKQVLIRSAIVIASVIALNLLFTVVFPVVFYQYLPFIALDFAGFFGVGFMLSSHLASVFIWFTLPLMLLIFAAVLFFIFRNFNKRDF